MDAIYPTACFSVLEAEMKCCVPSKGPEKGGLGPGPRAQWACVANTHMHTSVVRSC